MTLQLLADATDLHQWASRRDAQGYLPTLVRRLVRATATNVEELAFAAGEGVQLGGWDGIVCAPQGDEHVPNGISGWELGTNISVKGKADDDYEKRRDDPLALDPARTTFVFVTPRRWGGKDDWVKEKRDEGIFGEVRAYDAEDLESWLERAPTVHVWISRRLGKYPLGVIGLDDRWEEWSKGTRPETSPDLTVSGRDDERQMLSSWLNQGSGAFSLKAESAELAVAFLGATLMELPEEVREAHLARTVVVEDQTAWRSLTLSETPMLLVPTFDVGEELVAGASSHAHSVFIPVGPCGDGSGVSCELIRPKRGAARNALAKMGVPEARTDEFAGLARRSPMALRRQLSIVPQTRRPEWAASENARSLVPALLAGTWEDGNVADQEIVAQLTGTEYQGVSENLTRWSSEADPPARLVNGTWILSSKEDAWIQLKGSFTRGELERFEEAVITVLGQTDPAYELPVDDRWAAAINGETLQHSRRLREGLADTLALMASRAGTSPLAGGQTGQQRANRIVRKVLQGAADDWRVWASLSDVLPLLSEASPNEFLRAVEAALSTDEPVLAELFTDGEGGVFSFSPHTSLLWALEIAARSPQYLARASVALARLGRFDPGGRMVNRPINSLRELYMCLNPNTTASLEERMQVIDLIRDREPSVGWQLLIGVLPTVSNISYGIASPHYREWGERVELATSAEILNAIDEALNRLLEDSGESAERWTHLVGKLEHLPKEEQRTAVTERLLGLNEEGLEDVTVLRDELRRVISRHRSYAQARWALPQDEVDRLQCVYDNLEPSDAVSKHVWLFSQYPELPLPIESSLADREEELGKRRSEAIREIHVHVEAAGLEALAASVENPAAVGLSTGQSELLASDDEDAFLARNLSSAEEYARELVTGFVIGRHEQMGWEGAQEKLAGAGANWSTTQKSRFLASLPMEGSLYTLLESTDEETKAAYWTVVNPHRMSNPDDCEVVTEAFLEHDRPYDALETLWIYGKQANPRVPGRLIARALEAAGGSPVPIRFNTSLFSYSIGELMEKLYESDDVEPHLIARLEWLYLRVLSHLEKPPRLLHEELSRDPELFVDVVTLIYKSDNPDQEEEPKPSALEQQKALQAYELLDSWCVIPGTTVEGDIEPDSLDDWISQARETASARGRGKSADRCIGRVLAASPAGADGAWPHEAVRSVIDKLASDDVDRAFHTEVINSRGMYSRDLLEGGDQERDLARRYRTYAESYRFRWPCTSAVLDEIAEDYESWARDEDAEAELREDL